MNKKVVMIIAASGFRDEEYSESKKVLENGGVKVITASTILGIAKGKLGITTKVDVLLKDIKVDNYAAVIYIGGPGSYNYFNDPLAQKIAKETIDKNKILAAICGAPSILANAGLLKGKTATCFPGEAENLKSKGANYTGSGLEVDGNLITADGPESAKKFGNEILKKLSHIN